MKKIRQTFEHLRATTDGAIYTVRRRKIATLGHLPPSTKTT